MQLVKPKARLFARTEINWPEVWADLKEIGAEDWGNQAVVDRDDVSDAELLIEIAGRTCYRSFAPGLNPNVTKVRTDRGKYLRNILVQKHGSVLEHAQYGFKLRNVSRVLTAELNRHRAGTAISEQSLRYVRLDKIPYWFPEWAERDQELMERVTDYIEMGESLQLWMADRFGLDDEGTDFHEKKHKTSFMRRAVVMGVATDEMWSANFRTLRHVIEKRTDPSAEEEIRLVFGQVARIMKKEAPLLFGDFHEIEQPDGISAWVPVWSKV